MRYFWDIIYQMEDIVTAITNVVTMSLSQLRTEYDLPVFWDKLISSMESLGGIFADISKLSLFTLAIYSTAAVIALWVIGTLLLWLWDLINPIN